MKSLLAHHALLSGFLIRAVDVIESKLSHSNFGIP